MGALRLGVACRALRGAGLPAGADRIVVLTRHGARVAAVTPGLTPLHARGENLRLVCEALERAGVEHFVVRGYGNVSSAVGVRADDRPRVAAALTALCAREAGYVSRPGRRSSPGAVPRLGTARAWRRLAGAPVVRFTRFHASPGAELVLGPSHGCDIEFWTRGAGGAQDRLFAPRFNRTTGSVPCDGFAVYVPGHLFTRLAPAWGGPAGPGAAGPGPARPVRSGPAGRGPAGGVPAGVPAGGLPPSQDGRAVPQDGRAARAVGTGRTGGRAGPPPLDGPTGGPGRTGPAAPPLPPSSSYGPPWPLVRTRPEFTLRLPDEVRFPVDAVYTWVDGADPDWCRRRAASCGRAYHEHAANAARYANRDELRYSLRSLHMYAPWVRHVFLVTDRQVPPWLAASHPGVTVVDHRDIFDDPRVLPTFNSHAIETRLHHIDGLAEHFLYFNDDVFLGSPVTPQDFFLASGVTKFFPSRALVPLGPADPGADVPVSAAGRNNRLLLGRRFGVTVTQKMKHTPHALRRSVLAEIEREFPGPYRATMASRLRSASDISVPSALHHHYAFLTGRAVPGRLAYAYFDLSQPNVAARLSRLLRTRRCQAFCLNDTVSCERDLADQLTLLRPFLDAYFPVPGPLERAIARQEARRPCPSPSPSR
ncbi:stealth family protein [Streptomyces sp. B1866]|uniref:stealth family protein n=1 Tax=Streptomyces sp. B1866 TaxID=3075431 RepID=UPI00288DAC62|nr:stealth family protein [Streptomyces sp. B1866]MDT3400195.1 stealth family protein [Streptomyces sp. B1866]